MQVGHFEAVLAQMASHWRHLSWLEYCHSVAESLPEMADQRCRERDLGMVRPQ